MSGQMKDLGPAQRCLRQLVIAYNVFFWITGPAIVSLGIWHYIVLAAWDPLVSRDHYQGPALIIIIAGGTSIIAGIVGCLGGVNENRRFLIAYFVLMAVVCALEISACVYVFLQYDKVEDHFRSRITEALTDFYTTDPGVRRELEELHQKHSCCGIDGPRDWYHLGNQTLMTSSEVPRKLPAFCCADAESGDCLWQEEDMFVQGCLPSLVDWGQNIFLVVGWTTFAMASTQLLALAVISCFTKAVSFSYF